MARGQTALEYLFLVAGGLLFVTFIVLVVRGGVIAETTDKLGRDVGTFFGFYAKDYLFFDNFDTNSVGRWTEYPDSAWSPQNGQYVASGAGLSLVGLTLSNFSYSVWLKTAAGSSAGVVIRAQNATTYYKVVAVDTAGGVVKIFKVTPWDGEVQVGGDIVIAPNDPDGGLTLTVNATADLVSVFVNNQVELENLQLPSPYFDRGIFGLYASGPATFDNVMACKQAC